MNDEQETSTVDTPGSRSPLWFPSERRSEAKHFKSWQAFLDERKGGDRPSNIYNVALASTSRAGTENLVVGSKEKLAVEVPWMTFVLGSGCLMTQDASFLERAPVNLRARFEHDLKDIAQRHQGLPLVDSVTEFVELLARDRAGDSNGPGRGPGDLTSSHINIRAGLTPTEYPSQVALAAALATRLYAAALASGPHVIGPAVREEVHLDLASWWGASISDELLRPLRRLLSTLSNERVERPLRSQQALRALATRMLGQLPDIDGGETPSGMILRRHVELLTAFAWYFLTEGTAVYPGWSDLLLFQSFEDWEWFENEADNANPRPRLKDVISQDGWVFERIVHVTNASWESRLRTERTPTIREHFYDLVADFLHQQAHAIRDRVMPTGYGTPPLPVCFVSSFDLELEMALWEKNEPFIIVMPVLASSERQPQSASPHWVWARVEPRPEEPSTDGEKPQSKARWRGAEHSPLDLPAKLVRPAGWVRLRGTTPPPRWRGLPIVVRLTGSPLMDPPLADTLRPAIQSDRIDHALLLDEYTAIQQVALDFSSQPDSGLPTWITHNKATSAPRFWMLMGTQLADTGIRLRLMAQLMAARLPSSGDHSRGDSALKTPAAVADSEPDLDPQQRLGLLLNERSGTNDRELFLWNDLDVVDGTHVKCMQDLIVLRDRLRRDFDAISGAESAADLLAEAAASGKRSS